MDMRGATRCGGWGCGGSFYRSLDEFLAARGTFCIPDGSGGCLLITPPIPNSVGWFQPDPLRLAFVDYAGLADRWIQAESGGAIAFGTTFEGSITERPHGDSFGRSIYRVLLRTRNALTFVVDGPDFPAGPLLFGQRAPEVLQGAEPSLGESFLHLVYRDAPGAPLPDLLQLFFDPNPGQESAFLSFHVNIDGVLHEAAGVPEGTSGHVVIQQVGVLDRITHGHPDGVAVEKITLHVSEPLP
jgi:hypothetical protein